MINNLNAVFKNVFYNFYKNFLFLILHIDIKLLTFGCYNIGRNYFVLDITFDDLKVVYNFNVV